MPLTKIHILTDLHFHLPPLHKILNSLKLLMQERLNGFTVSRQTAKNLTVNRDQPSKKNFYHQPLKKQLLLAVELFSSKSFKSHYFSCSSLTPGSQRILLTTGSTSFHVPKYTHFTVFSTHLALQLTSNGKYFRFQIINDYKLH